MKDYYAEINKSLTRHEEGKYASHSLEWITDRIMWCWSWRKITEEQMRELAERTTKLWEDKRV